MSHVAAIQLEVRDLGALRTACEKLGLEFMEGQKTYRWYGTHVGDYPMPAGFTKADLGKCIHALRVKGNKDAYEVGVVESKTKPGTYELVWDFWAGGKGLVNVVGKDTSKLRQRYSAEVARKAALRSGMRVSETTKADGTILLRAIQ